jgi:hypothetical protein
MHGNAAFAVCTEMTVTEKKVGTEDASKPTTAERSSADEQAAKRDAEALAQIQHHPTPKQMRAIIALFRYAKSVEVAELAANPGIGKKQ